MGSACGHRYWKADANKFHSPVKMCLLTRCDYLHKYQYIPLPVQPSGWRSALKAWANARSRAARQVELLCNGRLIICRGRLVTVIDSLSWSDLIPIGHQGKGLQPTAPEGYGRT